MYRNGERRSVPDVHDLAGALEDGGFAWIGVADPDLDVEVIGLLHDFYVALGLREREELARVEIGVEQMLRIGVEHEPR